MFKLVDLPIVFASMVMLSELEVMVSMIRLSRMKEKRNTYVSCRSSMPEVMLVAAAVVISPSIVMQVVVDLTSLLLLYSFQFNIS